ncbi:MAG: PHP domain-containing protein [Syntrophomonadaceae bacterium]|jgi:predicted metal-dependent phosphoesterase TrpH|nr:PHP domain-containing protein [Syntrophomonadaceae bacterium]
MQHGDRHSAVDSKKFYTAGVYDLHTHSSASDGVLTPAQLVIKATKLKLTGLALSDHDTVDGISPAVDYINLHQLPLDFIPAIEMNTELDTCEVHILGYYIDYCNEKLKGHLRQIKEARRERAIKMVTRLRDMGMYINMNRVQEIAMEDIIARPHIARALLEKGYVSTEKEAFNKYIAQGKPAYVPRYKFEPQTALNLIADAGGVSVLAHPGLLKNQEMVNLLIEMGVEGLEVYYPEHSPSLISKYLELCADKKLLITGGSDYHGSEGVSHYSELGSCVLSSELLNQLKGHFNRKK